MSKELTEKLKKGKLKDGWFYCHDIMGNNWIWLHLNEDYFLYKDDIVEVLAPVPSYEELQKLKALIKDGRFVEALRILEK